MNSIKQGLFTLFLSLQSFFNLAYPLMLGLSLLGTTLGVILMVTPSAVQNSSHLISLGFTLIGTYLVLLKKYYPHILAWADMRNEQVVIQIDCKHN